MEMSVGFIDKNEILDGSDSDVQENILKSAKDTPQQHFIGTSKSKLSDYTLDKSPLGKVYIQKENVAITGPICVRYEKHPWIEQFVIDGLVALRPKRKGYGNKNARAFVQSLGTIYAKAYDDYARYCDMTYNADGSTAEVFDTSGYFEHVTERFIERYRAEHNDIMLRKFCGFVENMWREGDQEICETALNLVIPALEAADDIRHIFHASITEEFIEFLFSRNQNSQI